MFVCLFALNLHIKGRKILSQSNRSLSLNLLVEEEQEQKLPQTVKYGKGRKERSYAGSKHDTVGESNNQFPETHLPSLLL